MTREVGFDGLRWEYDYDPAGQLLSRTDPAGRVTRFIRDLRGRMIERLRPDGSTIDIGYDKVGRIIEADAPGSELVFRYDALGQVIWESQNGKVVEHEYDALGRRISRRSASGQTVEFAYDADSRLGRVQTANGSIGFEYDKAGRITKRRIPSGLEEVFHYDQCGCMVEQSLHRQSTLLLHREYKYDAEGNLVELRDSNKGTSRYVYDAIERLREVIQPEGAREQFFYDSTGNLLQRGTRKFRYDIPDRLTRTDESTLAYDEVGNLSEKRRAGSVSHYTRYVYDPDNRLISVESMEAGRVEFS